MTEPGIPRERFAKAQSHLLARYDLDGASNFTTIDSPVDTIHHLTVGEGSPIVFLPGVASPAALFVPLMAELTNLGTLHAIDRPGRGLSDPYTHEKGDVRRFTVEMLDGFLDGIGADTVDLVASSFGGFQAFAYTLDRPDRVRRISLVGSPAGLTRDLPIPFRLLGVKLLNRMMFRLVAADSVEDVRETMERINVTDASELDEELLKAILTAGAIPEQNRSLRTLFETTAGIRGVSKHMLVRDEVDALEHPMQFLWGTEDYFYPPSLGRELFGGHNTIEFVELGGAGHTPWLEPGNDVAEHIRTFLV